MRSEKTFAVLGGDFLAVANQRASQFGHRYFRIGLPVRDKLAAFILTLN